MACYVLIYLYIYLCELLGLATDMSKVKYGY